jgi:hypothetical protein
MEKRKFVAFLDILGFTELVKHNSHLDLIKIFKKFLFLNQYGLSRGQVNENAINRDELFNTDISKVSLISISDSIVLYTKDNSITAFIDIIKAVSILLNIGIKNGLPLRGSISCGNFSAFLLKESSNLEYVFSRQLLLGKALVEAYEFEAQQEWSGCIIKNNCIENFINTDEKKILKNIIYTHKIEEYNVPLKKEIEKYYVVNWIKDNSINTKIITEAFSKYNKKTNIPSVKCKISNTIEFADYIIKNEYFSEAQTFLEIK